MSAFAAAASDEDGDIISALRARVADLEAQLYAVGAGGVGKLEQPQSVTNCHQSQPQGEPPGSTESAYQRGYLDGMAKGRRDAAMDAEEGQEPVAWQYRMRPDWGSKKDCWGPWQDCTKEQAAMYQRVPLLHDWAYESRQLYTHPQPQRQPLTDAQINDHRLAPPYDGEDLPDPWDFKQGVRAAERAHKIGGEA